MISFSKIFKVSDFFVVEKPPFTFFNIFFCQPCEYDPVKMLYIISQVLKYAPDNAIAATVNLEGVPAQTNPALDFDRAAADGFRLDIPAGTSVRFEPGISMDVDLVELAGRRVVPGLRPEGGRHG